MERKEIIVIGAGIGGLTVAAELARNGRQVMVLEAHAYPGGCAGTFFYQGYRFDAGATLAAGFAPDMPLAHLGHRFGIDWELRTEAAAMQVHLAPGHTITRWSDPLQWRQERQQHFGPDCEPFWQWQERTAAWLWDFARLDPLWHAQNGCDLLRVSQQMGRWLGKICQCHGLGSWSALLQDAFRSVWHRLPDRAYNLRRFVDAQLLISAQTTSAQANALYAAAALDLARTGIGHVPGGMGGIAQKLVWAVKHLGGSLHYRHEVIRVQKQVAGGWYVETKRGASFHADQVVFNMPLLNALRLLGDDAPARLWRHAHIPPDGWGAFMLYLGVDESIVPCAPTLHHQLVAGDPLEAGNVLFLSFSPGWDSDRAPAGRRALTLSTHTPLEGWWQLFTQDREAYEQRKQAMTDHILTLAETFLPGLKEAADLILPATPVTFERFTRRAYGWVGGFPQTHLFRNHGPRLGPGLWLVGDSIFPGQSVPAVALGALRVAGQILRTPAPAHSYYFYLPQQIPSDRLPIGYNAGACRRRETV